MLLEGTFLGTNLHGQGQEHFPGGYSFVGMFLNGVKHGFGRLSRPDGAVTEGTYVNGNLHGMVLEKHQEYETQLKYIHGEPQPEFTNTYPSGWVMTGTMLHYKKEVISAHKNYKKESRKRYIHGPCKYVHTDGTVGFGEIKYDLLHGKWTTIYPNGSVTAQTYTPTAMDKVKLIGEKMHRQAVHN